MLPDDLRCEIALDAFGAGVPVGDDAVGIEHVQGVVPHALDEMLEAALGAFALGGLLDQPRIGRRQLRRAYADLAFQALLALPQRLFGAPPARDLVLRGAVELGLVDGDRGLDGDGRHDTLGAIVENAGLGMTEEQPAQNLAGARDHRHREIAAYRQMTLGHAEIGLVLAEARILGDVGRADDALAVEGGREHRGVARHRELGESFARRAGQGVERVGLALVVDHVVEERPEGCARQPRGRIGDDLDGPVEFDLRRHRRADLVQQLEGLGLFLEKPRRLPPHAGHVKIGLDPRQKLAGGERLDQVIGGTGPQPAHLGFLAGAGGEQDDRRIPDRLVLAHCRQKAEAVEARHHDVGQDEVGLQGARRGQRRLAVGRALDPIAGGAQQALDVVAHVEIVVGQQNEMILALLRQLGQVLQFRHRRLCRQPGIGHRRASSSPPAHRPAPARRPVRSRGRPARGRREDGRCPAAGER